MNGSRYPKHTSLEQHDDESSSTKSSTFINPAAKAKGAKVAVLIDARALPSSRENSYVQKQLKLHEDHEEVNEEFISKQFKHDTSSPSSACSALSKCVKGSVLLNLRLKNYSIEGNIPAAIQTHPLWREDRGRGLGWGEVSGTLSTSALISNAEDGRKEARMKGEHHMTKWRAPPAVNQEKDAMERGVVKVLKSMRVTAQQTIVMAENAIETISFQFLLIDQHLILDTARTSTCLSREKIFSSTATSTLVAKVECGQQEKNCVDHNHSRTTEQRALLAVSDTTSASPPLPAFVWCASEDHFGTASDEVNPCGDLDSDGSDNDEPELRRRWPAAHLRVESTAKAPAKKSRSRLNGRRRRQLQGLEALEALSLHKRRRVAWVFTQYQVVDDARRKSGRRLVRALLLYILRLIALYAEDGSLQCPRSRTPCSLF